MGSAESDGQAESGCSTAIARDRLQDRRRGSLQAYLDARDGRVSAPSCPAILLPQRALGGIAGRAFPRRFELLCHESNHRPRQAARARLKISSGESLGSARSSRSRTWRSLNESLRHDRCPRSPGAGRKTAFRRAYSTNTAQYASQGFQPRSDRQGHSDLPPNVPGNGNLVEAGPVLTRKVEKAPG